MTRGTVLVLLAGLGLIGLVTADDIMICPVGYEDLGNPQMRNAIVTVDVDQGWGTNGWQLRLVFDKDVKEAKAAGTRREDTIVESPSIYKFKNRGYNGLLEEGENALNLTFQVNERSEVKKNQQYAKIVSVKIRSTTGGKGWLELCHVPLPKLPPAPATPPPPPPCKDFYSIYEIFDSRDGGRCSNGYKANLDITFPQKVVGFNFTMEMTRKVNRIDADCVEETRLNNRKYFMKPYDNTAQIKYHKGEKVFKWDQERNNFGTFQVQFNDVCNAKYGQKVTPGMLPRPSKIVVKAKNIVHVMCEG